MHIYQYLFYMYMHFFYINFQLPFIFQGQGTKFIPIWSVHPEQKYQSGISQQTHNYNWIQKLKFWCQASERYMKNIHEISDAVLFGDGNGGPENHSDEYKDVAGEQTRLETVSTYSVHSLQYATGGEKSSLSWDLNPMAHHASALTTQLRLNILTDSHASVRSKARLGDSQWLHFRWLATRPNKTCTTN